MAQQPPSLWTRVQHEAATSWLKPQDIYAVLADIDCCRRMAQREVAFLPPRASRRGPPQPVAATAITRLPPRRRLPARLPRPRPAVPYRRLQLGPQTQWPAQGEQFHPERPWKPDSDNLHARPAPGAVLSALLLPPPVPAVLSIPVLALTPPAPPQAGHVPANLPPPQCPLRPRPLPRRQVRDPAETDAHSGGCPLGVRSSGLTPRPDAQGRGRQHRIAAIHPALHLQRAKQCVGTRRRRSGAPAGCWNARRLDTPLPNAWPQQRWGRAPGQISLGPAPTRTRCRGTRRWAMPTRTRR